MSWLRLIRWNNLLIIFLTQFLTWFCVLLPVRKFTPGSYTLSFPHFTLVCLSTVLIAAAGYIINDYFDIRIDTINRPGKMILERKIPRRMAILSHLLLNFVAIIMAGYVAWTAGHPEWLLLQLACITLLWFYSTHFKRQFMTGNVVVSLLTALTILTLLVYEPSLFYFSSFPVMLQFDTEELANPLWVLGIYTYFAFLLSWIREVTKDMEDFKGDAEEGCMTVPIKWGLLKTSRLVQLLASIAIAPLLIATFKISGLLGAYIGLALALPLIIWAIALPRQATVAHYHRMSRWLKIIMVLGIGSLIIYFYQAHG